MHIGSGKRMLSFACILLATIPLANCQWLTDFLSAGDHASDGGGGAACPLTDFRLRLSHVDTACCAAPESSCDANAPAVCTVACAATLRDFSRDCNATSDLLLDSMDGHQDGVAQRTKRLQDACDAIPTVEVLGELSRLQDEAGCAVQTDGVAETSVSAVTDGSACSDVATSDRCNVLLGAGLSCDRDFCPTCTHASECDATCGFCRSGDPDQSGHRRAQINLDAMCTAATLAARVEQVNQACCDDEACAATAALGSGVPTRCDARCAMVCESQNTCSCPFISCCVHLAFSITDASALPDGGLVSQMGHSSARVATHYSSKAYRRSTSMTSPLLRERATACRSGRCLTQQRDATHPRPRLQDPPGRTAYLADATQVPRHPRRPTRSVHRRLLRLTRSDRRRLLLRPTRSVHRRLRLTRSVHRRLRPTRSVHRRLRLTHSVHRRLRLTRSVHRRLRRRL